ncbi:MAG: hypothetical protein J5659_06675 [Clostridia bacterium]|nr:hypothetical protein [Clostridia bacterium]
MFSENDNDIKIYGDKKTDISDKTASFDEEKGISKEMKTNAQKVGKRVAEQFLRDAAAPQDGDNSDYNLLIQRRLLLSFSASAGFEQYIGNDTLVGIAQKSFLDTVRKSSEEIYKTSSDMGAFSFYYLAFRRGSDIERRMGQTFAMLCSHDGDPIFQELGEALYCWFTSVVRKAVREYL